MNHDRWMSLGVVKLLALGLWLANAGTTLAQVPQPTKLAPESKEFDFWIGKWDTEMSSIPDFSVKRTGTDTVKHLLNGRLVEEVFQKGNGVNFQRGYLTYLAREKRWQHIIYDETWGEYRFLGGKQGNKFVLQSAPGDTRPLMHRETFYDIKPDSFEYKWESSNDKGKTWNLTWRVSYQRAKKDSKGKPASTRAGVGANE